MKFYEKYESCRTWHEKAIVMEIFHFAMISSNPNWTLNQTALEFNISIGLVSENLRLASAIHHNPSIINIETRQKALDLLRNGKH